MQIEKVVLVDDDASIRRIAQISLVKLGPWQVDLAASGPEALALLANRHPDVLILDVMMPEMDGPTTLSLVREKFPDFNRPVIFMTAKVMTTEVQEYLNLGAAGVIGKPFNPKDLANQVRKICEDWTAKKNA